MHIRTISLDLSSFHHPYEILYVDNNATTQVAPEVVEAMLPFFGRNYYNPSSMYEPARGLAAAIGQARGEIARYFGLGDPKPILFTGCATESNNTAIFGCVKANPNRRHVITTTVEHPAVLEVCKDLERNGYEVTWLEVDGQGNLDVGDFVRALRPDTLLVTIMHANNESGVIFPVEQLARIAKETDPAIIFHTDATQSVGKFPIDLERDYRYVDLLSFSGHKLHAPKGIGVLYVKRGTPCRPFLIGGHQEEGRRAGTENVPYIVGLAKAVRAGRRGSGRGRHADSPPPRPPGKGHRGTDSLRAGQRPKRSAAAQHPQRLLPLRRRRGDALSTERQRDLRLQRLGLHLRLAGAFARVAGDETRYAPKSERFCRPGRCRFARGKSSLPRF